MSKLDIKFERLTPFKRCVLQNFPFIEEDFDALTNYQLLCKVVKYLNKVIDSQNKVQGVTEDVVTEFNNLYDYVNNYFDKLDVQEEINNKLDEMVEDGTLDTIISKYIGLEPDVAESMPYLRMGRKLVARANKIPDSAGYKAMQGGVMDSETTFTYISGHQNDAGSTDSDMCLLQKININTGEVLQTGEVALGHGNSIAYDRIEDKYYVTPASNLNGDAYSIIILDSGFGYDETITTAKNYDSISVDENGNIYAGFTYSGSEYAYTVDKLNKETFEVESTITLKPRHALGFATGQDFCVYDNRIYLISSFPNTVEIFDIAGNPIKVYTANDRDYIEIGETENISTWNGKDYIFGSALYKLDSCYTSNQVFITDFQIGCGRELEKDRFVSTTYNIYINGSANVWNPDGTSARPFGCIDEINSIDTNLTIVANFITGDYYAQVITAQSLDIEASTSVAIKAPKNGHIDVVGCKLFINGNNHITIDSFRAYKNSDVLVNATTLNKTSSDYLITSSQGSSVKMQNCTFDTTETYTNAFFVCDRGKFIFGDGNTSIDNKGTTRFFNGDINFVSHVALFTGSLSKDDSVTINGGYNTSFKELLIKFSDQNFGLFTLDGGNRANYLFANLSVSGTGNNIIYNVNIEKQSDNSIKFIKANAISFAADGTMTVNTSPSFNVTGIYAR